jgi:hypothetical protein
MPFLDTSHSKTKFLVKAASAKEGMVHITSFKAWKD